MRRFFQVYQFFAPLVIFPVTAWLWLEAFDWNVRFVLLALALPIVNSYVVPGIGTNFFRLWEFHTRVRVGNFRPQHGFVFGSATAMLVYLCIDSAPRAVVLGDYFRSALVMGSVLAFWNWFYDCLAIEAGFITVYNKAWYDGRGPEAVTFEYAPVYFGMVGVVYGAQLEGMRALFLQQGRWDLYPLIFALFVLLIIAVPSLAYMAFSRLRTGEWGLQTYKPGAPGAPPAPPVRRRKHDPRPAGH